MANTAASTLITEALDNLSRVSSGTTRSGSTMSSMGLTWLNRTQARLARKHDFKECQKVYYMSTVASTKTYQFPSNYKAVLDMRLIDGSSSLRLFCVNPRKFDGKLPYPENWTTRRPKYYTPWGNNFDLYPIPDGVYVTYCRCTLWPTIITVSSDSITYQPEKDDLIVAGITAEGFKYLQMFEDSTVWEATFKGILKEAILADIEEPDNEPVGEGFSSAEGVVYVGDYYNDPLIKGNI